MFKVGCAQEVMTPPVGVDLAGYFNRRYNQGMYDDLLVKALIVESGGQKFGFMTFELCSMKQFMFDDLQKRIVAQFGQELADHLIISCTHTHTGPEYRTDPATWDDVTRYGYQQMLSAALRALTRALMNLLPAELEVGAVYNNPYGFVRRYWMKNGTLLTNPGWGNPDIDKPECDFDRTINILAVKQQDRLTALICNIANHGDTIGGDIVSADWMGRMVQEIQHELKTSLPVLIVDDASGNINHFDFHQKINQSCYREAVRIGRGYARIVLDALSLLEPVAEEEVVIRNGKVTIPHRKLTEAEYAEAQHTLATVPDVKKDGDFESQDLANKVPAALRYFAQRAIDCHDKSTPSHEGRLTVFEIGRQIAFVSLPGEPFNGIGQAIREASPCKYTFIIELAQSESGYVPMAECFPRGGYEVMPGINTTAPEAGEAIIQAAQALL